MLVCSTGGHLSEMWEMRQRIEPQSHFIWAVPDHPQSRSLLGDEDWVAIPYFGARDWRALLSTIPYARGLLRQKRVSRIVSTGGSVVTPYLAAATTLGIPRFYIETVARTAGPSLTGKMAAANPGTHLFTQYPEWAGRRWHYVGSVFDRFAPLPDPVDVPDDPTVLVTLGTNPFPFDRAVAAIRRALPADSAVTWQLGPATRAEGLTNAHDLIPEQDLLALMAEADVVVAHAGAGSALSALHSSKKPILIPRLSRHGEMIDDHQLLIGESLSRRGLALAVDAEDLSARHLREAASQRTTVVEAGPIRLA